MSKFNCIVKQRLSTEKKKSANKFPIQIFFFFQKLEIFFWTSKTVKPNHYFCFLPQKVFSPLMCILKHEFYLNSAQLVDASVIDLSQQNFEDSNFSGFFEKNKLVTYYSFFFFYLKQRISFFFKNSIKSNSAEFYFSNANWLEREYAEMYGIFFFKKKDSRNLLLDYGVLENPFLKSFPSIGYEEVYFDAVEKNVTYAAIAAVEL